MDSITKLVIFLNVVVLTLSAPLADQPVQVTQDTHGYYKFKYETVNSTRTEERNHDGAVSGQFTYIDSNGVLQTVNYISGVNGFQAVGSTLPEDNQVAPEPVADTEDVVNARNEHLQVSAAIRSILPPLKEDGTVDETPIVPLSNDQFLSAIAKSLNPELPLVFLEDTPEIAAAKSEHLKAQSAALGL